MARTKQTSRKFQTKRPASSTHSSQEDSRPRKTLKPEHDEDAASFHSEIQMINSRDLNAWRKAQRQLIPAPPRDEFMQSRGSRPPLQDAGVRRRARAAVPEPRPAVVEQEEEEEKRQMGHHVSYGASSNQERDQRISGWAGSVASANAGDPDVGAGDDEASVFSNSPSGHEVADAQDEDGEDDKTDEDEAPAGQVVPSIEVATTRASAQANTRAAAPAQRPSQTLRRSAHLRQDPQVSIAHVPATNFDPVAHLCKSGTDLNHLPGGYAEAFVEDNANASATFKKIGQAFLDGPRPDNVKPFKRGNLKTPGLVFATRGAPIKTSEGLRLPSNALLDASEQNGAIEYFATHGAPIKTSASSSIDAGGDLLSICTLKYGGSPSLDEMSSCASSSCPCHDVVTLRHSRHYGNPGPGDAWRYRPIEYSISAASPSEV